MIANGEWLFPSHQPTGGELARFHINFPPDKVQKKNVKRRRALLFVSQLLFYTIDTHASAINRAKRVDYKKQSQKTY